MEELIMRTTAEPSAVSLPGLDCDVEYRLLITLLEHNAESRESSRSDAVACLSCGRGDATITECRREHDVTIKRHACTRCETYGASQIYARLGRPSLVRSLGDVQIVDLADDANARFRGTF